MLALSLASCADSSADEIAALEERVAALEEAVSSRGAGSSENAAGRTLQEGSISEPDEPNQTTDETAGDLPATTSQLPDDVALVEAGEAAFQNSPFFGEEDPEFGGTVIVGDADQLSVRLVRAGLEDLPTLESLLVGLGFDSADIDALLTSSDGTGEATSLSGAYAMTWENNPEGSEVIITRS